MAAARDKPDTVAQQDGTARVNESNVGLRLYDETGAPHANAGSAGAGRPLASYAANLIQETMWSDASEQHQPKAAYAAAGILSLAGSGTSQQNHTAISNATYDTVPGAADATYDTVPGAADATYDTVPGAADATYDTVPAVTLLAEAAEGTYSDSVVVEEEEEEEEEDEDEEAPPPPPIGSQANPLGDGVGGGGGGRKVPANANDTYMEIDVNSEHAV